MIPGSWGTTPHRTDTVNTLLKRIASSTSGGGGGGGGGAAAGEVLNYSTTGPTADGIVPGDLNDAAIAVKPGASTFTWDSVGHVWDDV